MPRLLVIEHSPTQAQRVAFGLEEAGFEVAIVADAEEGLRRLNQEDFDLVLSGLLLPGASGFDLCRSVKGDPGRRRLPVALMSHWADPADVVLGLAVGADGFINKSDGPEEMAHHLRRVLTPDKPAADPAPGEESGPAHAGPPSNGAAGRKQLLHVLRALFENAVRLTEQFPREVTRREQAEAALRQAHEELERWFRERTAGLKQTIHSLRTELAEHRQTAAAHEHLFTLSLDMLCVAGFDGYFKLLNPAWEHTLGFTREELLSQPYLSFIHPEDQAATLEAAETIRTGSNVVAFENRYRCQDGSYRWLLWNAVPVPEEERIYAVAHDITERRQAEETALALQTLEEEARIARQIQEQFFPKAAPTCPGLDLHGVSYPALAAGGDYFDYLTLNDGGIGIALGDVVGHGVGPALLMASTRAYLRALALTESDVGRILTLANRVLAADVGGRFVTLFLARLEPRTRSLVYASAGHQGYLLGAAGEVTTLESTSLPLGIEPGTTVLSAPEVVLKPGDLVFLPTDGILEAEAPSGEPFGIPRALEVIQAHRDQSARQIVEALYDAVRDFCRGQAQTDDLTAIILKVGPIS